MISNFTNINDEIEEPEELNDEDATLADDLLDEVAADEVEDDDELEGFGILSEKEVAEEEETEKSEDDEDGDAELEDDAEDVEFDAFDDIDEM
jgi:hypothetical protein